MSRKPETFYARIFGGTEDEFQDVFVYVNYVDSENMADCEIKMPLFINPSSLRSDVQAWLWEYDFDLTLGKLEAPIYAPQNQYIAI